MRKHFLLTALLCACLALCGCSYASLERQVYPICISVDLDTAGRYRVGIQAPQSSTADDASYDVMSATGDTPDEALRLLAASTPYPLNFCQVRLCLLGYELAATTDLRPLLRQLLELNSMRHNAYVMVAIGEAYDVMQKQKPDLGMRMSTHLNLLFERLRRERMLPDSTLSECERTLGDTRRDQLLCICAVNPAAREPEQPREPGGAQGAQQPQTDAAAFAVGEPWSDAFLPDTVLAGMLPRTGSNPVEYLGCAAVSDGRVSGLLTARETQMILRAYQEGERRVARAPDGGFILQLVLQPGTELYDCRQELSLLLEKLRLMDCDALAFGAYAARLFATQQAWEDAGFGGRFGKTQIVVW